jgi:hypothetical protein
MRSIVIAIIAAVALFGASVAQAARGHGVSRLTQAECVGLGGRIVNFNPDAAWRLINQACPTGKACITADDNGGAHALCIDEKD